jgi:hypothetical protein
MARRPKATVVKAVAPEQTTVDEAAPPTRVIEEHDAGTIEARSKEFYAERHARKLQSKARYGVTRIARSVQILAELPIPPPNNLAELLSPRYQAALRRYSPKAFANLKAYEPVINSSTTADE